MYASNDVSSDWKLFSYEIKETERAIKLSYVNAGISGRLWNTIAFIIVPKTNCSLSGPCSSIFLLLGNERPPRGLKRACCWICWAQYRKNMSRKRLKTKWIQREHFHLCAFCTTDCKDLGHLWAPSQFCGKRKLSSVLWSASKRTWVITRAWLLSLVCEPLVGKALCCILTPRNDYFCLSISFSVGAPSCWVRPVLSAGLKRRASRLSGRQSALATLPGDYQGEKKCERGCWAWSESKRNRANEGDSIKGVRGLKNKEVLSPQQSGGRGRHSDIMQPKSHYCVKQVGSHYYDLTTHRFYCLDIFWLRHHVEFVLGSKRKITSKDKLVLFYKPVRLLITHTAGWFLDLLTCTCSVFS